MSLAVLQGAMPLVLVFYAGSATQIRGRKGVDTETIRLLAWREQLAGLANLNYTVFGISSQSAEEQLQFAYDASLFYPYFLSDRDLELADVLDLPTTHDNGKRVYMPLTMIVDEGIRRVFYPVDPERDAINVSDVIRTAHA